MLFPQLFYTLNKGYFFPTQNRHSAKQGKSIGKTLVTTFGQSELRSISSSLVRASQDTQEARREIEKKKRFDDFSFHNKIYLSL